jgi:rubrerythrin
VKKKLLRVIKQSVLIICPYCGYQHDHDSPCPKGGCQQQ